MGVGGEWLREGENCFKILNSTKIHLTGNITNYVSIILKKINPKT